MKPPWRETPDGGFTLVELLVAITIMVLVVGSLGLTMSGVLRSVRGAQERVDRAQDTILVGYVFPNDVNSASTITAGGARPCGSSGTPLLQMTTTNVNSNSSGQIWYTVAADTALVRYECGPGGIARSTRLAESVTVPSPGTAVECQKQTTASPYFVASSCGSSTAVDRVALTLTINDTSKGAAVGADAAGTYKFYGMMP